MSSSSLVRWPDKDSFLDRSLAYVVLSVVAYLAADRFLTIDDVSVWFPPAALTLAYLVMVGAKGAPVALACRLALGATVLSDPFTLRTTVVTGVLVVGAYTVAARWLRPRTLAATNRLEAIILLGRAGAVGALGAATLAVGWLTITGESPIGRLPAVVGSFWLGDASAVLTLAPLLIFSAREEGFGELTFRPRTWPGAENLTLLALILGTAWFAVGNHPSHPSFYPAFIPLVWVAMRRGLQATTATLALSGTVVPVLATFNGGSIGDMTAVQLFLLVYAATGLVLGAVEGDRRATRMLLARSEERARAEHQSLVLAEATQRATLEALEQGIALATITGEVRLLNPAGARIVGRSAAELTEMLQSGNWHTYDEHGELLPVDERPITHTMLTGEAVSDRVVGWRRPDDSLVILRVAIEPLKGDDGAVTGVVIAFADITRQREMERAEEQAVAQLAWQAYHDQLTGLANRSLLMEHLERAVVARRDDHHVTALLYLDLDHFKPVNDTMGHEAGDELLAAVADRLRTAVREGDVVARFGGDEFVILAEGLAGVDAAMQLAGRIGEVIAEPLSLAGSEVVPSASIGLAIADGRGADELLGAADAALYRAKQAGRGRCELFEDPRDQMLTVSTSL